ncbi:TMEM165/GDT1 family protein [Anaerosalibacter sp. Marseille-P3206]|uniref:TMEM165/GDT1 family protein n=1 Tax=Anaerosalibacter sp. Marseille-P3206 TaxID=1871005 RepID=UPI000985A676|nr:TMEM165/GDT1 family protein [Anaerosalibacter sp. Marseille-P3206]
MLNELLRSFLLIFAAEMGDKTQILAMTFATQFSAIEVLIGVALGVFLNHGIAIVLGRYISKIIPLNLIQIIAGLLFVAFGVLALVDEEDKEESKKKKNFGPIFTVALAFFIGELGDKTQLTAMTLSTEGEFPFFILLGTTLGMVAVSGIGIFVGCKICKKIPEIAVKIASATVFITFGTIKLFQTLPARYLTTINIVLYFVILSIVILIFLIKLINKK